MDVSDSVLKGPVEKLDALKAFDRVSQHRKNDTRTVVVLSLSLVVILIIGCLGDAAQHSKSPMKLLKKEQKDVYVQEIDEKFEHPKAMPVLNGDQNKKIIDDIPKSKLQTPYSFEDIFDPLLRPRGFDGNWLSDNMYSYRALDGNVYEVNATSLEERLLVPKQVFDDLGTGTYFVSPDSRYVLIAVDRKQVWRHSWTARYKIFNVSETDSSIWLVDFPNGTLQNEVLQYARWGSTGHVLTFVYGNNLYYQGSPHADAEKVTDTGVDKYVYNGIPDWVYEEDVIASSVGHHMSPDNQYIAYVEYTSANVPLQSWPLYGSSDDVYGDIVQITYPKAGDTRDGKLGNISIARVFVAGTDDFSDFAELPVPEDVIDEDGHYYYTRVAWQSETSVYVFWTNRAQNYSMAVLYDIAGVTMQNNYEQEIQGGWIDAPSPNPIFINEGEDYLTILPQVIGESGTWPHVALVTAPNDSDGVETFLSTGEDNVFSILAYDVKAETVYYLSSDGDGTERHIKRVGISGSDTPECLTCDFPNACRYVTATFSPTAKYYIERCGGPAIPSYRLKSTDGLTDMDLENNTDVQARLEEKELPARIFADIDLENGNTGKSEIFLPFGYTGSQSYPLLVYVYGGPNSQRVTKAYNMASNTNNWLTYMKSTHKIVVASVDGRGTSGYGDLYRYQMYRDIATVGVEDQLAAVRGLRLQDYVTTDENAAIFGWSYGGFMASQLLAESNETEYKCGIAVAPVTTKRYYDSAYTERYLAFDLPSDNEAGYNNTDVLRKAAQFRGKDYLIAHGTADDNVHFMHMTQLVRALVEEDIQFRQLMYVDENHNIAKPNQARHLYTALTNFLLNDCYETI